MPTFVYTRYSPRPVREGDAERIAAAEDAETLKLQIDVCERLAVMQKLTVDEIIRDPETSARKERLFDREGGSRLKDLPRGSHIICSTLDRMFRNTVDGLLTVEHFKTRGIALHFADLGGCTLDTSSGIGEFMFTVLLGKSALEPRQTADRTSKGMKHRQKAGQRMTRPGYSPYGTTALPDGSLVPNPAEQAVADRIMSMHDDGLTYSNIATELNDAGVPRRKRGTKWDFAMVRSVVMRRTEA